MKKLIISIIIAVLFFGGVMLFNTNKIQNDIEFNDVQIRGQDYQAIKQRFGNETYIRVCDIEKGNCILLTNLEKLE